MFNRRWWTQSLPLNDAHDVLARVGFRFLWTTAPYLILIYLIEGFTSLAPKPLERHFLTIFMVLLPIVGGIVDWWRLHPDRRTRQNFVDAASPPGA